MNRERSYYHEVKHFHTDLDNSDSKKTSRLSKAHVAKLFQESHFQHATAHMNPIAKAFLEFYLNVAKSVETFSEYVEDLLTASQSAECAHISEASIEKLAVVANAVNEMHEDCEKAKQDLWLLVGHASAGNHLHKFLLEVLDKFLKFLIVLEVLEVLEVLDKRRK